MVAQELTGAIEVGVDVKVGPLDWVLTGHDVMKWLSVTAHNKACKGHPGYQHSMPLALFVHVPCVG